MADLRRSLYMIVYFIFRPYQTISHLRCNHLFVRIPKNEIIGNGQTIFSMESSAYLSVHNSKCLFIGSSGCGGRARPVRT